MRGPVHIVLVSGFVAVLGVWTYLLITPQPVPEKLFDGVSWFDKEMLIFLLILVVGYIWIWQKGALEWV